MQFNSLEFLFFFPIVVFIYFIIPKKVRYIWLLITSYYFYMCWNVKYILLILFSTVVSYLTALLVEHISKKNLMVMLKRGCLFICVMVNLSLLLFFKYFDFFLINLNAILGEIGISVNYPKLDVLLPVGISFYTFQALGYVIDVYRQETKAEKNFLKFALFISFFPQLVAGPIERSKNLLRQVNQPVEFKVENARYGLLTMAYGLTLKIVVADNIAKVIDPVFQEYEKYGEYGGMFVLASIVLFAFQIYCDFHGYTQIAIGSAKILGFNLQENFNAPYFSLNIREFWRKWHMSLTSWFTDYLYIPLGGNRKGKVRTYLNTIIVFLLSGLWHGASWGYVVWGGINGIYIIVYDIVKSLNSKKKFFKKLNRNSASFRMVSWFLTFIMVDYAWLYFRVGDLKRAIQMQGVLLHNFYLQFLLSEEFFSTFFESYTSLFVVIFSLFFVFITDCFLNRGIDWKQKILDGSFWGRWLFYLAMLFVIIIFGAYGGENGQTQFLYFQF